MPPMLYRRFGKTGLRMPVISIGGMRFPKGWEGPHDQIPDETLESCRTMVLHALERGAYHFETARGYGRSERAYGLVLQSLGLPRDRYLITTKIGPTPTHGEMRKAIDESLERLRLDYLDNFDIHGINTAEDLEMTLKPGGCLQAVRDAMKEGLIRHLGFSTHAPVKVIVDAIASDEFESVNLHYYYFFQVNRAAVALAQAKDMGVFIISPTEKGGFLFRPPERLRALCAPYTPIEMNDRWLLGQPAVHTLSCGSSTPEELDQHLGALREPFMDVEDRRLFARLETAKAEIPDFCTECQACMPCPEDIHIPEVLRMRNITLGFDLREFAAWRYNQMRPGDRWYGGNFGDKCTDCGACLPLCPSRLEIPRLLRETHRTLAKA